MTEAKNKGSLRKFKSLVSDVSVEKVQIYINQVMAVNISRRWITNGTYFILSSVFKKNSLLVVLLKRNYF